jgi:hypothetical protein
VARRDETLLLLLIENVNPSYQKWQAKRTDPTGLIRFAIPIHGLIQLNLKPVELSTYPQDFKETKKKY